ncbi:unnamed protein product [Triticum turgidum subsp. durum]|uniref:Uncharacterized protein n=1 Tax=Triticum turgidum subsp. durum TaxID=4567 RepID=A0A9R1R8W9_TRITD|nr:unnamed protein product [Triticum turgidum subsp. durum]
MDLVSGRVIQGCSPSWRGIKPPRFPLLLGSWAAAGSSAFPGCSCALAVCRNASAVVPFAKKKRKGYSVEPPDGEEEKDDVPDVIGGEVEDVDVEEEEVGEEDAGDDGNGFLYSGEVSLLSFPCELWVQLQSTVACGRMEEFCIFAPFLPSLYVL